MKSFNRRNFLRFSSAGAAGILLTSQTKANTVVLEDSKVVENKILTRKLGSTGLELPVISIGKLPIENEKLVRSIFESGVVHIDSAHGYHDGKNDEMIGQMLKEYDRSKYILSTKIHLDSDNKTGKYKEPVSAEIFTEKFNESLKRQGVEYVDILYLHMPPGAEAAMDERLLSAMRKIKEEGRAKHLAVSTHSKMAEIISMAARSNFFEIVLTTYNYQLKPDSGVKEAIQLAYDKGLGLVAMKTQAGKYLDKEQTLPVNSSAAVKWALQDANVTTALVSVRTYEELELYKALMSDINITDTENKELEASLDIKKSLFCQGCNKCSGQCPYGLPIPDLMRAYMYAYGYKDIKMSYELVNQLAVDTSVCSNCNTCKVDCPSRFDIAEKIRDISRIKDIPLDFIV